MGSLHANAKHTHHIFSQLQGYVFKKKEKPEQPQRLRGQPLQNKHALKKDATGVTSQSRTITTSCALTPPYLEAALLSPPTRSSFCVNHLKIVITVKRLHCEWTEIRTKWLEVNDLITVVLSFRASSHEKKEEGKNWSRI